MSEVIVECEPRTVFLAHKLSIIASKRGEVISHFRGVGTRLKYVLYILGLGYIFVLFGRLADYGITLLVESDYVELKDKEMSMIVGYGIRCNGWKGWDRRRKERNVR